MPEDSRRIFQANLLYYMKRNHVTQQDIANTLGVSKSTVSDWCHGKNYPRIDVMQRLADFFGVVMNNLVISTDHSDELTEEEKSLVTYYREAAPAARSSALLLLKASAEERKREKEKKRDTESDQTA